MKKKKTSRDPLTIPANDYYNNPECSYELINKYGTYNIQPTADTENPFPKIAQGLPKAQNRRNVDE